MGTILRFAFCSRRFTTKVKTIDPEEIKNFAELANEWWNVKGKLAPLHEINKPRLTWLQNRLRESGLIHPHLNPSIPSTGLSVLDVGCGGGILSESLSRLGYNVTGIDATEDLIEVAKLHAKTQNLPNLRYITSTIQDHAAQNKEKYDVVVSSEVIEHVSEKDEFIKYCVECVKSRGSIFITSPNKTWLAWFQMIVLFEDVFKIIPKGTHRYDMFLHLDDLKEMLRKENCETLQSQGVFYLFFLNRYRAIKNTNVIYFLHAVKR